MRGILNNKIIDTAAEAVQKISHITEHGEGNFNFAVNFNCKPLVPYFPAGYHQSKLGKQFVIGLETPNVLLNALQETNETLSHQRYNKKYRAYYGSMSTALNDHTAEINQIIKQSVTDSCFRFAGIDSSAAPSKDCTSMASIYREMGLGYFGAPGTIEASSRLMRVFKSVEIGFSGLILALKEDTGLAQGSI